MGIASSRRAASGEDNAGAVRRATRPFVGKAPSQLRKLWSRRRMTPQDPRRLVAIALVSAAVILLQVSVTRILSVVVWYHWAFFAISLAMLGVGAPGVWFSFVQDRERWLRPLLLAAALLVPAGVVAIVSAVHLFPHTAILFCLAALLPAMLALGAAVCVLLLEARGQAIGRIYAFDLLGACVGALVVVPLLNGIPTPALAGALGLLPLVAYALLGGARAPAAAVALLLLGALAWGTPFEVRHSKVYDETRTRTKPIYERWTSTARITIFDNLFFFKDPSAAFGWGMGSRAPSVPIPKQYWIEQDGSAGTPLTKFDGDASHYEYLFHDVTTIGYQLRPPQRVAIVGSGGGRDILTARLAGAREIDAIELNGAIVDALRGPFAEFSGHVYDLPGVHAIVGEGRSVLTRSAGNYDLIQISLIDSWAATTAGAYSLSESNLYTIEAYRRYWSRLSERGQVSTSRWAANSTGVGVGGAELPRLILLVQAALRAEGVADPDAHLAVVQGGRVATVLMSRIPFEVEELARLRDIATARGFDLLLPESSTPQRSRWLQEVMEKGAGALRDQGLRLDPPTDDKPFFFQVVSPFQTLPERVIQQIGTNGEGVAALRALVIAMSLVAFALFFVPFALGQRLPRGPEFWRGSAYFVAIGLAFLFVEVAWVQRLILYVGHPSHATTVGLAALLLGAGIGASLSQRVGVLRGARLGLLLPVAVAGINAALAPVFEATLGWPLPARVATSAALLVPAGVLMGFPFPLGMMRFGDAARPWYWALNGVAGVLASTLSLALSMEIGFSRVAALGAGLYAVAWWLLGGSSKRCEPR